MPETDHLFGVITIKRETPEERERAILNVQLDRQTLELARAHDLSPQWQTTISHLEDSSFEKLTDLDQGLQTGKLDRVVTVANRRVESLTRIAQGTVTTSRLVRAT